ncbi:hypothetical protein EON78_02940 [bacterium]|nr:MAG: hypothetical protein EON78_02940 [bacterium]
MELNFENAEAIYEMNKHLIGEQYKIGTMNFQVHDIQKHNYPEGSDSYRVFVELKPTHNLNNLRENGLIEINLFLEFINGL